MFVLAREFGRLPAELRERYTRTDLAELWLDHLSVDADYAFDEIRIR